MQLLAKREQEPSVGQRSREPWVAWTLIVLATATLVYASHWSSEFQDAQSGDAGPAGLAVLKFQAKNIIGLAEVATGGEASLLVGQLRKSIAGTDVRSVAAVAALENFLRAADDGEKQEKILANLDAEMAVQEQDNAVRLMTVMRLAVAEPSQVRADQWGFLKEQLGWFGELAAASQGGPEIDKAPLIRQSSKQTAEVLRSGVRIALGGGVIGSVLLFVALWNFSQGRQKTSLVPADPRVANLLIECFAVYLSVMALCDLLMIFQFERAAAGSSASSWILQNMLYIALLAPVLCALLWAMVFRRKSCRGIGKAMGLHCGRGLFTEIGCGLIGYVAILPVVAVGLVATVILVVVAGLVAGGGGESGIGPAPVAHPIIGLLAEGDWKVFVGVLALASVAAPLFEETLFRGALHGGLRGRGRNFWISAAISAVIFAAIHPQGLMALPALGAMGFGFAMLREWRGSLLAPMTAHALHNGTLVAVMWLALGG